MKLLALAAGLLVATWATASGDFRPSYTRYKAYTAPDIALARFQEGELGVIQPGMQGVYLYTAWRAMMLGPGIKSAPGTAGGLARADGSAFGNGWDSDGEDARSQQEWYRVTGSKASQFSACPSTASLFALQTFKRAAQRPDATPERLKLWVGAQELVFSACKAEDDARYDNKVDLGRVLVPAALPDQEPAYWRQLRDYQRAATLFHAEQYHGAIVLFDRIGSVAGHPMRDLGRYLALRSEVRQYAKQGNSKSAAIHVAFYAALEKRAQSILADTTLTARHEATRATLRSIRAFLLPGTVFMDLSRQLADPAVDPFIDDRLGDWAAAIRLGEYGPDAIELRLKSARARFDFINWIETLHDCAGQREASASSCDAPAALALAQWQQTRSRPWLAAALMLASTMPAELETAALAVKPGDPEFVTIHYHLARLYRLAGRVGDARTICDAALTLTLSPGSRNLFQEERFAVATSVADAAAFMLRVDVDSSRGSERLVQGFNEDVLNWLNDGLSTADMLSLARNPVLPKHVRARLASASWMRAELLGKNVLALQSAELIVTLTPAMNTDLAAYRRASGRSARHHRMLLTALKFGLSPHMAETSEPIVAVPRDEVRASNWCSFKPHRGYAHEGLPFPWLLPAPPAVGRMPVVAEEADKLKQFKTATGHIGDHVLARAAAGTPNDPDLPWLLHVVVASTRGGCLDADAKKLSKDAFNMLRKRFPGNEWTKKTPYFY